MALSSFLIMGAVAAENDLDHPSFPVPHRRPHRDGGRELLIFSPVGNSEAVMEVVSGNIRHARGQIDGVDVYLAHWAPQGRQRWQEKMGSAWYEANVDFSAERAGFKFLLVMSLLTQPSFDLRKYRWVWALDDDIDITPVLLPRFIGLAETSGALIAGPAFIQLGETKQRRKLRFPHQSPNASCLYRYTRVVEVIMPMIDSRALEALLTSCEHCVHNTTSWGLDHVWCSWTAKHLGRAALGNCAIVDATVAVHKHHMSLAGKYNADGSTTASFREVGMRDFNDTQDHNPQHFAPDFLRYQTWCVARPSVPPLQVYVLSRRSTFQRRSLLRVFWHEAGKAWKGLRALFTLCGGEDEHSAEVAREAQQFGDVLLLECSEGCGAGALTRKVLLAMRHFAGTSARFFMKVDDDTFVAWSRLGPFLARFGGRRLYLGRIHPSGEPIRDPCHQFYEPNSTFPGSRYPLGMMGGSGYILGEGLVTSMLLRRIPDTHMLYNEDRAVAVWVDQLGKSGGLPADLVDVPAVDHWEPEAGAAAPSWATWGDYPYFLHHHLRVSTVACLFLAEQTQDKEVGLARCFEQEAPSGVSAARTTCWPHRSPEEPAQCSAIGAPGGMEAATEGAQVPGSEQTPHPAGPAEGAAAACAPSDTEC